MLCVAIIILQSTLTHTSTIPHVTYYWKTTEYLDKVYDYWNHGPIYIPGLQNVFTPTTKAPDLFPPWLTGSTHSTRATEHTTERVTIFTTTTPEESPGSENQPTDKSKPIEETKEIDTAKTEPTTTTKTLTTQHIIPTMELSESEEEGTTDPFSVFLRKLFRSLSVKSLPELPALVQPFVTYLEELVNNKLKYLGDVIVPFIKKVCRNIRKMTSNAPDVLHAKVYHIYNALSNRQTLDADIFGLLNVLDDTFDEAEEEFMQSSLTDVKRFPNSNKTGQEIAQALLDNIVLAAIMRVAGTSQGETLSLMVTDIIENRKSDVRRHLKKKSERRANDKSSSDIDDINYEIHKFDKSSNISDFRTQRKKKSVDTRPDANIIRFTRAKYETVRNNLKDIRHLMDKVVISSSETNEYELTVDSESEDTVKSAPEQTDDVQFRINSESKSLEYSKLEELHKMGNKKFLKKQRRYKASAENVKHSIEHYSKAQSGDDGVGLWEWIKTKKDKNKKKTLLVPQLSLLTKLIKDNVHEFDKSKKTRRYIVSHTTYGKDKKKKGITKPMKTLSPGDGMMSHYIHDAISRKNKHNTKFTLSHITNTHPSRYHSKLVSTTEGATISNKKRRPDYSKLDEHLESTQLYTGKSVTKMKYTKDNNKTELSRSSKKYLKKGEIKTLRMHNSDKNITEIDDNDEEYMSTEGETSKESKDSMLDAEYSSEDTGDMFQKNQENINKTVLSPVRHSQGGKKYQKHLRNHRHRHRHKKRRHKHGHKHSHHGKRKYKSLKRKYEKLKEILAAQKVNYERSRLEENKKHVKINIKQGDMKVIYPKSSDISRKPVLDVNYDPSDITTPAVKGNLRVNKINLFLDDYDDTAEITTESYTIRNYGIFRKALPPNTKVVFEANESSDAEKELKENIHDTIRHMDYDNYNLSRRSYHNDNTSNVRIPESPETDVEAVLKSNIYKAVKILLKK